MLRHVMENHRRRGVPDAVGALHTDLPVAEALGVNGARGRCRPSRELLSGTELANVESAVQPDWPVAQMAQRVPKLRSSVTLRERVRGVEPADIQDRRPVCRSVGVRRQVAEVAHAR